MDESLFAFDAATLARPAGGVAVRDLAWAVRPGETWAVVGPTGSGKSTLAEAVLGRLSVVAGAFRRPAGSVRLVAFKEDSRLFSYRDHYYQQRYDFGGNSDDPTLDQFLRGGLPVGDTEVSAIARRFGIAEQLPLALPKLSNGQTRRARLARAVLAEPDLLILDDPFVGLDAGGRDELAAVLGELVRDGRGLLLVCRAEAVPGWVTHVLELDGGEVKWQGARADFEANGRREPAGHTSDGVPPAPASDRPAPAGRSPKLAPVLELRDVSVRHAGRLILDRITWTVRAGERWALLGPNGSGKTTLLAVVCGDHPQAYGNDVRLFGRRRGDGESIWEVKRRVGFVSPEFHLYFAEPLTAAEAAATGFHDVLVYRPIGPEQAAAVRDLFAHFGLADLADTPFRRLSAGQQRLVLFVRALVKSPPLLVLDEPFQGLDAATVRRARDWLDTRLRADQTLVFVSHHPDEIPASVTHRLRLDEGRVTGTV